MFTQPINGAIRNGIPSPPAREHASEFVFRQISLPCPALTDSWERLVLNDRRASRSEILRTLGVQMHIADTGQRARCASHGAILFYGPSGTGKSTLAAAAPNMVLKQLGRQGILFEVNTHSLPGAERGACQKNICRLFAQIEEASRTGPTIFLVFNELETLASSRQSISLATNPLDTSLAVNALIESIDNISVKCPNVFFLATTNLVDQIDSAIFDRFDEVFRIPLPNVADRLKIIAQAIEALQPSQPLAHHLRRAATLKSHAHSLRPDSRSSDDKLLQLCDPLIKATRGLSPRRLTQLPVRSLGLRSQEFSAPLTLQQLVSAANHLRRAQ